MPAQTVARIKRAGIPKDPATMARWLLGKVLVRRLRNRLMAAPIVETEAYLQHDRPVITRPGRCLALAGSYGAADVICPGHSSGDGTEGPQPVSNQARTRILRVCDLREVRLTTG